MRLLRLKLQNFRKHREFEINPMGENISIYGTNKAGKTTSVADPICWLLFDKDSLGQSNFDIKPRDPDTRETIHRLETIVEAKYLNGSDQRITLKKTLAEKYGERGKKKGDFLGHDIGYYVNGVPVSATEYKSAVANLVGGSDDTFKLLTDPRHFCNDKLTPWTKRREILYSMVPSVTDDGVIERNPKLAPLLDILESGITIQQRKTSLSDQSKKLDKQRSEIPARIDQEIKGKVDVGGISPVELAAKISTLTDMIRAKQKELVRLQEGGELAQKKKALAEIEAQLIDLSSKRTQGQQAILAAHSQKINAIKSDIAELELNIRSAERMSENESVFVANYESQLSELRQQFQAINSEEFAFDEQNTCPTCRQPLPEHQVAAARQSALEDFNIKLASQLAKNNAEGKRIKADKERLQAQIQMRQEAVAKDKAQLDVLLNKKVVIESEVNQPSDTGALHDQERQLIAGKEILEAAIKELETSGPESAINTLDFDILAMQQEKEGYEKRISAVDTNKAKDTEVKRLKDEEKRLAAEIEKIDAELELITDFTRAKNEAMEGQINALFELVDWQLYRYPINGDPQECCDPIDRSTGVPYSSTNGAERIRIGCDIVRVLQKHYSISTPLIVDNRESVVELPAMNCQVISLVVSEADKELRIEKGV